MLDQLHCQLESCNNKFIALVYIYISQIIKSSWIKDRKNTYLMPYLELYLIFKNTHAGKFKLDFLGKYWFVWEATSNARCILN